MTPEQLRHIDEVFCSAIELPSAERDEFVRRAFRQENTLYDKVRRMLEAHSQTGALNPPLVAAGQERLPPVFHSGQLAAGRYRIVRFLERGGMGEVYEAQDRELGIPVALKTLLPAIAADELMIARFKREIALSRTVTHRNVCKVFDIARHEREDGGEIVFLTMELLAGETLSAALNRNGAMTEAEALPLLAQMASALDASHRAGVIHRDFKPSNVMLVSEDGVIRAVVMDFGLARKFAATGDDATTVGSKLMGTLNYMAPELLTGAPATFASDMYAFGMTAYQMVAGRLPFSDEPPLAAAIARLRHPVPSPRMLCQNLDTRWETTILRSVDRKPENRFHKAGQFVAALRRETDSTTVTVLQPFRFVARAWARRAMLAAAIIVISAAGIAGAAWERARHRLPPEAQLMYSQGAADIDAGAYFAAGKALEEAVKLAPHAPLMRARLAEALLELDSPERASEQMLQARRENLLWLSKADRLHIEAIDLGITHEYAAAAAKYVQIARKRADNAEIDVDLGRAYGNAGRLDEAISAFRRAAEGPSRSPAAWLRLGEVYAVQRKKKLSEDAFAEADRLYQLTSNLEGIGETALQRGIAATGRSELDTGAEYLRSALHIAQYAGNWQQEITATLRLSTNAYLAGDPTAAERYAGDGLDLARHHNLNALAVRGLVNLGNAFRLKQNYEPAEQRYHEALDLAMEIPELHLVAYCQLSLAGLHWDMKRREEAASEASQALSFYRPHHYAKEALQSEIVIARFQRDGGQYEAALASLLSVLQTAQSLSDTQSMAAAHGDIGNLLFDRDHFPEALVHYRESLELASDAQQIGYAAMQCGNTLWRLGNYVDAEAMFGRADNAAEKFAPLYLQLLYSRAGMLLSQDKTKEAAEKARSAITSNIVRSAEFDANVSDILCLSLVRGGSPQAGLPFCERAWNAVSSSLDTSEKVDVAAAIVEARISAGKRDAALAIFMRMKPDLDYFPEVQWRVTALASLVNPDYRDSARNHLLSLIPILGLSYTTYRSRPDVDKLSRLIAEPVVSPH